MKEAIASFIASKSLSPNSQAAYRYDLEQFLQCCEGQISEGRLAQYRQFLTELKPAARQRKLSAVNQFLYFLYEQQLVDHFWRLGLPKPVQLPAKTYACEDLSILWEETAFLEGQLVALLVAYMGLTPSEIAALRTADIQLDFRVLTVKKGTDKRVVTIPETLLAYLQVQMAGFYLFDKSGHTYSRQWFFNRLSEYVASIGHREWTAQKLREQFILHELADGRTMAELMRKLGLKTQVSLEKYV